MAHREWHRCTFCHAPWLDGFTRHQPACPLYVNLTPNDPMIFNHPGNIRPMSEFFDKPQLEGKR